MRLKTVAAHRARIPLKKEIKHASKNRSSNDALLVRVELDDGTVGWGEGLPREYVTGETIETCFDVLRSIDFAPIAGKIDGLDDAIDRVSKLVVAVPSGARDCFGNSVRCAVEIAYLDAVGRIEGKPLSCVTEHFEAGRTVSCRSESVRYDGVITSAKPWKEAATAFAFRLDGFERCKLKVGVPDQDEVASVRRVRRFAGDKMDLRVDANEGWPLREVIRRAERLRPFGITAIEQPVRHEEVGGLVAVRRELDVPIVLDESLCGPADARRAVEEGLCDVFNLRLSKCGGYLNCLRIAAIAGQAGLSYQLGCMVGETGILSAAGRHFATSVGNLRALEGSFDRHLVSERLTREDLTFGRGGLARALGGPGSGVEVDESAVRRVSVTSEFFRID